MWQRRVSPRNATEGVPYRKAFMSQSTSSAAEAAVWRPSVNPWWIAVAVMLAAILEVLDTSIANVALPNMAGSMASSLDEATWVLTSYLVANAIVLPMTGWLSSFFGRKRFLVTCTILFSLSSAACGLANSMAVLILARIVQGAAGGALLPMSQAILMESFPPAKRGVAMAVYGMGVVVAPIFGPVLGGWLTDNYSWRWIFFINVPFGILAVLMLQAFVEDPPYLRHAREKAGGTIDYIGFAAMAISLAALQLVLDRGQDEDWFTRRGFAGVPASRWSPCSSSFVGKCACRTRWSIFTSSATAVLPWARP